METQEIWHEFLDKLKTDALSEDDCAGENKDFLMSFLTGEKRGSFREKIVNANASLDTGETKHIVTADCGGDRFRFDFVAQGERWRLCFIECITIPIKAIDKFPYAEFPKMPEHEIWIRAEKNISRTVYLYCRVKESFGKDKALEWFLDGAGEFLAASSWIPFFNEKKASIAYLAWCESRINGENASIEAFGTDRCVIKLRDHLWFKVYNCASHLKLMIPENEYRDLFEHIWLDRGKQGGWSVTFNYAGADTEIIFDNAE